MTISVDTEAIDKLEEKIKSVNRSTMYKIGTVVKSDLLFGFRNETDPSGKKWKPLKKSTLRARKKKGHGAKILQDTGNLKRSLNFKAIDGKVTIGYNASYAVYHQPTRKILPTEDSEVDISEIREIIIKGLTQ